MTTPSVDDPLFDEWAEAEYFGLIERLRLRVCFELCCLGQEINDLRFKEVGDHLDALAGDRHHQTKFIEGICEAKDGIMKAVCAIEPEKIDPRNGEILWRVIANHFVAGIITKDDVVVRAAPILRWTLGKTRGDLREYFQQNGWKVEKL